MTTNQTIKDLVNQKFDPISQKIENLNNLLKYENVKPIIDEISKKYDIKLNIVGGIKRKGYSEHDVDVETEIEISKDKALSIMFDIQKMTNSGVDVFVPSNNYLIKYGTTQSIGGWTIHKIGKEHRKVVDKYATKIDDLKKKLKGTGKLGKALEKLQMERFKAMESVNDIEEEMIEYYLPEE